MRITSWNCAPGKDVDLCLQQLASLCADLVTLQECRRPRLHLSVGRSDLRADLVRQQERRPDGECTSVIWGGTYPERSVAVVSTRASLELDPVSIPNLHPTVVPVVVRTPKPFLFVGVWTHEPYVDVARKAMCACARKADKLKLSMVAAGDFNISPCVTGMAKTAPEFVEFMEEELELVSAYHRQTGKDLGSETCPTLFFNFRDPKRKDSKQFHIDYCFVPKSWCDSLVRVRVEPYSAFQQSDHRPLTVEIKDEIFGISSRS